MKRSMMMMLMMAFMMLFTSGCGSEMATGAAIGGGVSELLRETIKGADADFARKKAKVIAAYNAGVERGAMIEELDELARDVDLVIRMEAGKDMGKTFLGFNYTNPRSGDIATLIELGIILFGGRKLIQTGKKYSAEKKGIAKALTANGGTATAKAVYDSIAKERQHLKLPVG